MVTRLSLRYNALRPLTNPGFQKLDLLVDERRNHAPAAPADPVVNRYRDDELPNGYVGRTNMNP